MKNMLGLFYASLLILHAVTSLSAGEQSHVCESICQKWGSIFRCRQFTSESFGNDNLGKSFAKLYRTISDLPPVVILPSELMSIFNVQHDPCNRGETSILENGFENRGGACVLRTQYELPIIGQSINFVIEIPARLHGAVNRNKDSIYFQFLSKPSLMIHGGIMTDYLNIQGKVNDIEMSKNMITVSVDVNNSLTICFKIAYE